MKKLKIGFPEIAAFSFFLLTILTMGQYGFFSDEFYYFACSKHLAFGYVDHPPLVALLTYISSVVFGETLFSMRFMSGIFGAITVILAARIAASLGGGKFSQNLAALSICFSTAFPALSSFFSMNVVDITLCSVFFLMYLKIKDDPSTKNWIFFGLLSGLGLMNKYTFLVLGFAFILSILLTRERRLLLTPGIYYSGFIAIIIFLPHILWQINNGWPTLEFMHNAAEHKNLGLSLISFFIQLIVSLNPITLLLWLPGIFFLLFNNYMKEYRALGYIVIIFMIVYLWQNSKVYYVIPIFPLLLAAGSVYFEKLLQKYSIRWLKYVVISLLVLSGSILLPLAVPLLPVDSFVNYSKTLGLWNLIRMEKDEGDTLPLHFVHRFGWEELVNETGQIYNNLPDEDRNKCAILTSWYGSAGAIDHLGKKYNLPPALSPRNSYWLWGYYNYTGEIILVIGYNEHDLLHFFNEVKLIKIVKNKYAYNQAIFLCKKPKYSINEIWVKIKVFI